MATNERGEGRALASSTLESFRFGTTANGYPRGGMHNPGIKLGPSLGFAYDVFGNSKTILRGGYRIAYDRIQGNTVIFPAAESAPTNVVPTFNFGTFSTVGNNSGGIALAPFNNVLGVDPDATIPRVQSFSLQIQQEIGFETVVSIGYVGTLSHHLSQRRNLNYIPYGATFLKQNQDPFASAFGGTVPNVEPGLAPAYVNAGLSFSGTNALRAEYLRRYPGYGDIPYYEFGGSSNYHSLQATAQRRFTKGLTFGAAYTWSKAMGTANADNDFTNPICTRCYDYRILNFDRTHVLALNYVWELPRISRWLGDNFVAKGVLDGWEFSGHNPTHVRSARRGRHQHSRRQSGPAHHRVLHGSSPASRYWSASGSTSAEPVVVVRLYSIQASRRGDGRTLATDLHQKTGHQCK